MDDDEALAYIKARYGSITGLVGAMEQAGNVRHHSRRARIRTELMIPLGSLIPVLEQIIALCQRRDEQAPIWPSEIMAIIEATQPDDAGVHSD